MQTHPVHNPLAFQVVRKLETFGLAYDRWTKDELHRIDRLAKELQNHPLAKLACKPYVKRDGTEHRFDPWNLAVWAYEYGVDAVIRVLGRLSHLIKTGERWYEKFYSELRALGLSALQHQRRVQQALKHRTVPVNDAQAVNGARCATSPSARCDSGGYAGTVYQQPRGPD